MKIGNREFATKGKTYIMGILNVTPDSFSDGGKFNTLDKALNHAQQMIDEGADILDIGGESTRPGHSLISDEEEISRVVPVIERLKQEFDIPISLDTYKSKVAEAGIKAGADLINDVWGLKYDADLAKIIAKYDLPCCLMHNRHSKVYTHFLEDVNNELQETINLAHLAGIKDEKIILDPGIGFGKTPELNLTMLNHLDSLKALGYPLLLGTSRKSTIGLVLDTPVNERVEGTLVTSVLAAIHDYMFVRVHDVKANYRAVKMMEAIKYETIKPNGGNI